MAARVKCKCGCGKWINKYDNRGRLKKFHPDCFSIGKSLSEGAKKYLSKKAKEPKRIRSSMEKILKVNKLIQTGIMPPANWKGGISSRGRYVKVKMPTHPGRNKHDYVSLHRLIMEEHIGRYLLIGEVVHHINGNKKDNRIENLMLLKNESKHQQLHYTKDNRINKKDGRFIPKQKGETK